MNVHKRTVTNQKSCKEARSLFSIVHSIRWMAIWLQQIYLNPKGCDMENTNIGSKYFRLCSSMDQQSHSIYLPLFGKNAIIQGQILSVHKRISWNEKRIVLFSQTERINSWILICQDKNPDKTSSILNYFSDYLSLKYAYFLFILMVCIFSSRTTKLQKNNSC